VSAREVLAHRKGRALALREHAASERASFNRIDSGCRCSLHRCIVTTAPFDAGATQSRRMTESIAEGRCGAASQRK
jgi:hypothetical protein